MQELETYLVETDTGLEIKKEYVDKLNELKKEKARVERELKTLSTNITNELKTKFNETTKVGGFNLVVKGGFYDMEFDIDTFKNENFELYIKYLVPHESAIQYQLASATRTKEW